MLTVLKEMNKVPWGGVLLAWSGKALGEFTLDQRPKGQSEFLTTFVS